MDIREKLVELLINTIGLTPTDAEIYANDFIAHGVTVQEWVSVDDRLPEDDSDVIAYLRTGEEGRISMANYAKGVWFDCILNKRVTEMTTHWMPLPEPQKGE